MSAMRIPKTTTRVEESTSDDVNDRIQRDILVRVSLYQDAPTEHVERRLEELDREWDIERTLEANAASLTLAALVLGKTVNRRWYAFPAVIAGFLLQHAIQGWCPPIPVFRRLGVRTAREIDQERDALRYLIQNRGRRGRSSPAATNGRR